MNPHRVANFIRSKYRGRHRGSLNCRARGKKNEGGKINEKERVMGKNNLIHRKVRSAGSNLHKSPYPWKRAWKFQTKIEAPRRAWQRWKSFAKVPARCRDAPTIFAPIFALFSSAFRCPVFFILFFSLAHFCSPDRGNSLKFLSVKKVFWQKSKSTVFPSFPSAGTAINHAKCRRENA